MAMRKSGQIALLRFPQVDLSPGKAPPMRKSTARDLSEGGTCADMIRTDACE
jgi:hypothetical protein